MDLVSIIVPCYNQAEYLPEALDSILKQTYQKWECIIVNDGSPDNTEVVAKKYCSLDNRFTYIQKRNGGIASARNTGIASAKGEFILPLDADDKIGDQYLELAIDVFNHNPSVKVVYCEAEFFGSKKGPWILPDPNIRSLLLDNMIFCSALFRKSDFNRVGGYNTSLIYGLEDWEFWLKILNEDSDVYKINNTQFYYRQKLGSRSSIVSEDEQKAMITRTDIFKTNSDLYLREFGDPINIYKTNLRLKKEILLLKQSKAYRLIRLLKRIKNIFNLK